MHTPFEKAVRRVQAASGSKVIVGRRPAKPEPPDEDGLVYLGDAPCSHCGGRRCVVRLRPDTPHWAEARCSGCGRHISWLAKPDSQRTKRPAAHRDLVHKYSDGFCELCLLKPDELPPGQTLEAHHIIEVQDGGSADRENIWIVCTKCARLIHWMRTHAGRSNPRPFWHRPPEA